MDFFHHQNLRKADFKWLMVQMSRFDSFISNAHTKWSKTGLIWTLFNNRHLLQIDSHESSRFSGRLGKRKVRAWYSDTSLFFHLIYLKQNDCLHVYICSVFTVPERAFLLQLWSVWQWPITRQYAHFKQILVQIFQYSGYNSYVHHVSPNLSVCVHNRNLIVNRDWPLQSPNLNPF